ncbi:MAG: Ribosome-associated translation inhibitor RaiA [Candidatus Midichloria mitochondrii]|uniref:Ribosome hibernation promoting factor n=2 Tax=Candidatus Midichloria mitochondrii TaxID=234827 RepID=F7XUU9_MIDMI|nr:Sigma(54) modulation protein [Candidatus Midichloria mitochondrii IricVA]MDJ1256204.1 ribosome-associated translation inhibitor RaiA [Candidatus Midichloria mitochondrii]MDJ1298766.1 ribosome-associated translation inhibitor RaiA [Candidatus Midichloria mitochondrii]
MQWGGIGMQILISGKHLDVGESLRQHITFSVEHNVIKFFEYAIKSHVTISKQNHLFKTDIIVNEGTGTGTIVKSNAQGFDPYKSFDEAMAKLAKQLRRYKSKIRNHHRRKIEPGTYLDSVKYVIETRKDDVDEAADETPIIIAEKPFQIERMSVSDAVMHMDIMDLPAYMFINGQTGATNVVYYRKDGNISWIRR